MNTTAAAPGPEIVSLFTTPLVVYDVPDAAPLNADLQRVIEQRESTHPDPALEPGRRSVELGHG